MSAEVRCIDCAKFSVQRAGEEWQRKGYGCCDLKDAWLVFGAERSRDCANFEKATQEVRAKRETWLKRTKTDGNDGVVGPADSVAGGRSHTNELLEGAATAQKP